MNRVIKFRGLRPDTGNFAYGFLMYRKSDGVYFIAPQESSESFIIDESTIGQFTGLHDKNGVEIYEGDIVVHFESETKGRVKWQGCGFMVEWIDADVYSDLLGWYNYKRGHLSKDGDYTITGNIHQTTTP